ncbi:MAG TPA: hypothetical protein EYP11_01205, partial [Aquificaceae bacterium]|nr:hypothetical protein [Aquificaceae bacterium]
SIIDELPPGRKPVITSAIPSNRREEVIAKIEQWTIKKHQTYWACTLIEESDVKVSVHRGLKALAARVREIRESLEEEKKKMEKSLEEIARQIANKILGDAA